MQLHNQSRLIACPHPFTMERIENFVSTDKTIRELIDVVSPELGRSIPARVFLFDELITEDRWNTLVPPSNSLIIIRAIPSGGGGDNKFLRTIAFVALMAASTFAGWYVGTYLAHGAVAGAIAAGAVSMMGSLLINALIPPTQPSLDDLSGRDSSVSHSISGTRNRINPYGPIPVILGRHRVIPPLGAMPYTEVVGDDIYLRQVFVIGYGPLELSDFKIGEDAVENFQDVDMEVREGYADDDPLTLFTEDVYEEALDIELTQAGGYSLQTTQPDTDEAIVDLTFKAGLFNLSSTGGLLSPVTIDFEIQFSPTGENDWSIGADFESFGAQESPSMPAPSPVYDSGWGASWANGVIEIWWVAINKATGQINKFLAGRQVGALVGTVWDWNPASSGLAPCPSTHAKIARVKRRSEDTTISAGSIIDVRGSDLDKQNAGDFAPSVTSPKSNKILIAAGYLRLRLAAIASSKSVVRISHRFKFPEQGQYDIRIRRTTADGSYFSDVAYWTVLRSITSGTPINKPELAMVALRIRATDQLNGVIDQFNCIATSICLDWDYLAETWTERPTANPASLFRHILQGPANKRALADSRINLTDLQDWHERCNPYAKSVDVDDAVDKGGGKVGIPITGHAFTEDTTIYVSGTINYDGQYSVDADTTTDEVVIVATYVPETFIGDEIVSAYGKAFNMPIDFKTSVDDILRKVTAAGKATPAYKDGLWTIVEDKVQADVIQHFSPRNSWGFQSKKTFIEMPHALRVRFLNEDEDWQEDERIVYDDGYNVGNATLFEQAEFAGVTNPEQVHVLGRYHIAAAKLRPEIYSWNADIEHIVCTRGDLVRVAYDAPLWGVAWGRVKGLTFSGDNVTHIDVDNVCAMEAGNTYSCRFRLDDGSTRVDSIVLNVGEQTTLEFTTPIAYVDAPKIGNLFLFGETGSESVELVIKNIEPSENLTALITAVDYSAAVHLSDTSAIPAYSTNITLPYDAAYSYGAPTVQSVKSDDNTMTRDANGSLKVRMLITLAYIANPAEINRTLFRYRPENSNVAWESVEFNGWKRQIWVTDVEVGITYEYEIQYEFRRTQNDNTYLSLTAAATGTHTVTGKIISPEAPTSPAATAVPKGIRIEWTSPVNVDLSGVAIWRNTSDSFPGGDPNYVVYASPGEAVAFVDRDVSYDVTYYYWLKSIDTSENVSDPTDSVNSSPDRLETVDIGDAQITTAKIADSIQSNSYVEGVSGWYIGLRGDDDGYAEFGNVTIRGLLKSATFEYDTLSAVSGSLAILKASDVLAVDMTGLDASTLVIKGAAALSVGDVLRIKDNLDDEWLEVTDVSSAPTYIVTRDKASQYAADSNPAWKEGIAIVNYGQSGDGGMVLTASEVNAPRISIFKHAGSPWASLTKLLQIGNLNGFLGYASDLYGIAIGESTKYLKYDPVNGLRIKGDIEVSNGGFITSTLLLGPDGYFRTSDEYPFLEFSNTGLQLKNADSGGTYGTAVYGTDKYGYGAMIWIMNRTFEIPWFETKEPKDGSGNDVASFHMYDRAADPSGATYSQGEIAMVTGLIKIYRSGSWYEISGIHSITAKGADATGTPVFSAAAGQLGANAGFIEASPGKYVPYWTDITP